MKKILKSMIISGVPAVIARAAQAAEPATAQGTQPATQTVAKVDAPLVIPDGTPESGPISLNIPYLQVEGEYPFPSFRDANGNITVTGVRG